MVFCSRQWPHENKKRKQKSEKSRCEFPLASYITEEGKPWIHGWITQLRNILTHQHYIYRTDSEEIPQCGWDTYNAFLDLLYPSAIGTDVVYKGKSVCCSVDSCTAYIYIYTEFLYTSCIHAFVLYRILCISSLFCTLIPVEWDSLQIFITLGNTKPIVPEWTV